MSAKRNKSKRAAPTTEDVGAAMLAWYAESIRAYPDGLVTQAQAAQMLNISRMGVSRLVARGYLRAVYFPHPPDVAGVTVADDDPTWLKIVGWLGIATGETDTYAWPKACYVAFADVVRLWENGEAREKCKRDWNEIIATALDGTSGTERQRAVIQKHRRQAELERRLIEAQKEEHDEDAGHEGR